MPRSAEGRQMAWRVLGHCCRPTLDRFMAVLLFGMGGTLLMMLWTFEPQQMDQGSAAEEIRRQIVDQILRERDQELDGLKDASDNDLSTRNGPPNDQQGTSSRRVTENRQRPARFDAGSDNRPPEIMRRNTGRNRTLERTARLSTNRSVVALRPADYKVGRDRISSDDLLRKVRRKLIGDVTQRPEADRRSDDERPVSGNNDSLVGSRRWCSVYNTTPEVEDSFHCVRMLIKPPTTVCIFPDAEDEHVSRFLRKDGLWEPHIVRLFQNLLFQNPDLGVIDVGAHVGQYSLLAAVMGRRVVAVEPHRPSVRRLHRAIKINNVQQQIVVVENAVSDVRGTFQMNVPSKNQGGARVRRETVDVGDGGDGDGIASCDQHSRCVNVTTVVMDDLLEVVDFRRAAMKIDIEGHERRAFLHADRLFDNVKVDYIFMEWLILKGFYGAEVDDSEDKRLVQRLVDWLTRRGYTAHSLVLLQRLNPDYWYGWPEDIFWQHRDADPFL